MGNNNQRLLLDISYQEKRQAREITRIEQKLKLLGKELTAHQKSGDKRSAESVAHKVVRLREELEQARRIEGMCQETRRNIETNLILERNRNTIKGVERLRKNSVDNGLEPLAVEAVLKEFEPKPEEAKDDTLNRRLMALSL